MSNPEGKRKRGETKNNTCDVTSRQTSRKRGLDDYNWRGSPRTGDVGEKLSMSYAPGGDKGLRNKRDILAE